MIFREDTTFPFLALARETGESYARILQMADLMESGALSGLQPRSPVSLAFKLKKTIETERRRREAARN